jgi:hypothetical protein
MVTSRRALDAALVLDNLTTHEDHSLCDRDGMPKCTHVARSVCAQVHYDVHNKVAMSICGCAQLSTLEAKRQVTKAGDIDSASPRQRVTYEHVSRNRDHS